MSFINQEAYAFRRLYALVPDTFMNGRLFIYGYKNRIALRGESTTLLMEFVDACRLMLPLNVQFMRAERQVSQPDPYEIRLNHVPTQWPDRTKVWRLAVMICPKHYFAHSFNATTRPPNYLLYGCDPKEFKANMDNDHYQWNALFGHAVSSRAQLSMMMGIDMLEEADEFTRLTNRLGVTAVFLQQIDARRRTIRQLPNNSISRWTDYAPPVDWQLQQALVRVYLEDSVGKFWQCLLNYTGVMYQDINRILRNDFYKLATLEASPPSSLNISMTNGAAILNNAWHLQWLMALSPPLPKPCIVYRYHAGSVAHTFGPLTSTYNFKLDGEALDNLVIANLHQKKYVTLHGFTSTTINLSYVLSKLVSDIPVHLLEIHLPTGTHCCSWPSQEYELILPHYSVAKFVDSYVIGTNLLPNPPQMSGYRNVQQVRVLVFQLIYDGIDVSSELAAKLPASIRDSIMPLPDIWAHEPLPKIRRHASHHEVVKRSATRPLTAYEQILHKSASRARSAQPRLMKDTATINNPKKRVRPYRALSRPLPATSSEM